MTERFIRKTDLPSERRVHPSLEGIVVGEIKSLEIHPNADDIRIAKVDVGRDKLISIVFGGQQIEYLGARVAVALKGTPTDSGRLRKRRYRGEISEGMICAAVELDLISEGPDEILILPQTIPVGTFLNSIDKQIMQSWLKR